MMNSKYFISYKVPFQQKNRKISFKLIESSEKTGKMKIGFQLIFSNLIEEYLD